MMICSEFTISNRKRETISVFTDRQNMTESLKSPLVKPVSESYKNFILMDDFNSSINSPSVERNKLDKLCILF